MVEYWPGAHSGQCGREPEMRCVICRHGETAPGKATVVAERGVLTLVVKGVPAEVCTDCGEEYIDEAVVRDVEKTADEAEKAGVQVEVKEYRAA